jgi:hypothetical protein
VPNPASCSTGTYTQFDNWAVRGAGAGYRLIVEGGPEASTDTTSDYIEINNQDVYASSSLMFGGSWTSTTGGASLAGVALTGKTVLAQVDFMPTTGGAPGAGVLSWFINGVTVFGSQPVVMPPSFFIGFAASTSSFIQVASLTVTADTPMQLVCASPPSPPPPVPNAPEVRSRAVMRRLRAPDTHHAREQRLRAITGPLLALIRSLF